MSASSWLGKVWANRILQQDRAKYLTELERSKSELDRTTRHLQGEIEKTIYVHRLHFETEFRALQEVWQKVVRLRLIMASIRPIADIVPADWTAEEETERLQKHLQSFIEAANTTLESVDFQRPFLTEEIYTELSAVLNAARAEANSLQLHPKETTPDWYERGKKNLDQLVGHSDRVIDLIRARLDRLSLYPALMTGES